MNKQNWIDRIEQEVKSDYSKQVRILSFHEYMLLVEENARKHLRSSAEYVLDMLDYFGRDEESGRFKVFDLEFGDPSYRLIGLEEVQENIYKILQSFVREGMNNKLILLHGPNGSAKTSLINCMVRGMEEYSTKAEGSLYKFHWIFPNETYGKHGLGLGKQSQKRDTSDSFAKLADEEIVARIPCDLKDHPLFLIPLKERKKFLTGLDVDHKVSDYLMKGDLSHKSQQIFESLLRSYNGDYKKVLKHIQVERFFVSKRYREAAATIEPQMTVDAQAQQMTMDKSWGMLPPSLHSLNLINLRGDLIDGNRGVVEFNDLLKRPVDAFKYLLVTCETGTVSVAGTTAFLDAVLFGTCNELQLDAFKEYPDFTSFKARVELVRVPYQLNSKNEKQIYETQIHRIAGEHHVAPHTTDLVALWAVLCRLKKPNATNYPSSMAYLINALTPKEKAELYAAQKVPSRLSAEDRKLLKANLSEIKKEYSSIPYYEGRTGPSPREIKLILFDAIERNKHRILSPLGLFDSLESFVQRTSEYEYLRENIVEGYHDCRGFIQVIRDMYLDILDDEVRSSLGMYDEKQFEGFLKKYISHVSPFLKNEKVYNPITGNNASPDIKLIEEFEKVIQVNEDKKTFRQNLITAIGVYTLDNPNKDPDYTKIFPDLMKKMRTHYQDEHKNLLKRVHEAMVSYVLPDPGNEDLKPETVEKKESARLAKNLVENLTSRYGYNEVSAKEAFSHLVQKRY